MMKPFAMAFAVVLLTGAASVPAQQYVHIQEFAPYGNYAGIVSADFDGDGVGDIALSNTRTDSVEVYLNRGDGTFGSTANYAYSFGSSISRLTVAQFDSGPGVDIAVLLDESKTFGLLRGNGDGSFTIGGTALSTSEDRPQYLTAFHATSKAYFDLAIANRYAGTMTVYISNGDGTFGQPVVYQTSSNAEHITAGDLDNDGDDDLAVGHGGSNTATFHLNNGNGDFSTTQDYFVTDAAGHEFLFGNFNGDAYTDAAIGLHNYDTGALRILQGKAGGGFDETQKLEGGVYPRHIALKDMDGINGVDVVTSDQNTVHFFMNNGSGTFTLSDSLVLGMYEHQQFVLERFDGDGVYDIALAGSAGVRLYLSDPPATGVEGVPSATGVAVLHQNYPNPASKETTFAFELPERGLAVLSLYTLDGRLVKTLSAGMRGEGPHVVAAEVSGLSPGTYYIRLTYNGVSVQRTMTVLE